MKKDVLKEKVENRGKHAYSYSSKEKNLGTVNKNEYKKGMSNDYHYETDDIKTVVPATILLIIIAASVGIFVTIKGIELKNAIFTAFGIIWLIFDFIFISDVIKRNSKKWKVQAKKLNERKNKETCK